jgi:hypothetical protein
MIQNMLITIIAAGDEQAHVFSLLTLMFHVQCRIDILAPSSANTHSLNNYSDQPDFVFVEDIPQKGSKGS